MTEPESAAAHACGAGNTADALIAAIHAACQHRAHRCPCACACDRPVACDCFGALCARCHLGVVRGDDGHAAPAGPGAPGEMASQTPSADGDAPQSVFALNRPHTGSQTKYAYAAPVPPSAPSVPFSSTAGADPSQRPSGASCGPVLTPAQVAAMEQWLAQLHQGTNVAPLDWFVALFADHAARTARLAAVVGERDAARVALRMVVDWGAVLDADATYAEQRAMGVLTVAAFEAQYGFDDLVTLRQRVFAVLREEPTGQPPSAKADGL